MRKVRCIIAWPAALAEKACPPRISLPAKPPFAWLLNAGLVSSPKICSKLTPCCRRRSRSSRSVCALSSPFRSTPWRTLIRRSQFLGILYLDSRRSTAFSKLDRQILDAVAVEAASILDNARLVERERERQRIEQELNIARQIQQALLPRGFRDFPYLAVSGVNLPCHACGGDYFDVFPMND